MSSLTLADVRPLLDGPSAAVLTTVRKDGSPLTSPVWFDWTGEAFEIVIARDDVKLRHLAREPRCTLVIFEAVAAVPRRGPVAAHAQVTRTDITEHRRRVARRYLGEGRGDRFVAQRAGKPGDLVTLVPVEPRVWSDRDPARLDPRVRAVRRGPPRGAARSSRGRLGELRAGARHGGAGGSSTGAPPAARTPARARFVP